MKKQILAFSLFFSALCYGQGQYNQVVVQSGRSRQDTIATATATSGQVLTFNGIGSKPSWQAAGGGTKDSSIHLYGTPYFSSTSVPTLTAPVPGASGYVWTSNGTSAAPSWQVGGGSGADTTKLMTNFNYTQFNVKNYGAVGDGVTNDQPAVQKAINAAFKRGGGWVYFPPGKYNMKSSWQTVATDTTYCQLMLPSWSGTYAIFIGFMGATPGNINIQANTKAGDSTSVLMTTDTNTTGGIYSLISGGIYQPFYYSQPFTNIYTGFQNIVIQTPFKSAIAGARLRYTMELYTKNLVGTIDSSVINMVTAPPYKNHIFIETPGNNNWANVNLTNTWVEGYYVGFVLNEHADVKNLMAYFNVYGYQVNKCYHTISGYLMQSAFNKYDLYVNSHNVPHQVGAPTTCPLTIFDLDVESDSNSSLWNNHIYTVLDTTSIGHGLIKWHNVNTGTSGIEDYIPIYGGTNFAYQCIDNDARKYGKTLSGTGSNGYLPCYSTYPAVKNSGFFYDGKFTGLGRTNPKNLFDVAIYPVNDSVGEGIQLDRGSSGNSLALLTQDIGHNGTFTLFNVSSGANIFLNAGNKSYISTHAYVGVNLSNPQNIFDVGLYGGAASDSVGAGIQWDRPTGNKLGQLSQDASHDCQVNLFDVSSNPQIVLNCNSASNSYFKYPLAIGQSTVNSTAILDISSTTKGVVFPRMTTTQKNAIVSPTEGLIVYDLTLHEYFYWNGTTWVTPL